MFKLEGGGGLIIGCIFLQVGGGGWEGYKWQFTVYHHPVETVWMAKNVCGSRGGVLPYKSDGGARRKISRTPLKGTRILFYGRVPNSSPPLRGTNSTTTNNIIGTANFNSNKDNFRKLSSQGLFKSIVINLYPYKAYQLWQQSFKVLAPQAVPVHKCKPLQGTTSTPISFIGEYPPPPGCCSGYLESCNQE